MFFLLSLLFWTFCAICSAVIASKKNRNPVGWFFLGALLGPLAFIVAAMPAIETVQAQPPITIGEDGQIIIDDLTKKCLACAEIIKLEAIKCRFCGYDFDPAQVTVQIETARADRLQELSRTSKKCPICHPLGAYKDYSGAWFCPTCNEYLDH